VPDETQLAGGAPSDVLITEVVAANLHTHLAQQGRNVGGPQDVGLLLHRAVERAWGTKDAPRFSDKAGGGWIVDLSGWVEGEMLYALIRTVHGRRTLTTVVEADEYEGFMQSGEWQSPAAVNPEAAVADAETLKEVEAIEKQRTMRVGAQPAMAGAAQPAATTVVEDPNDPILIVYKKAGAVNEESQMLRCTRAEVPEKIRDLLSSADITEDCVEIWSRMSKPKISIQF